MLWIFQQEEASATVGVKLSTLSTLSPLSIQVHKVRSGRRRNIIHTGAIESKCVCVWVCECACECVNTKAEAQTSQHKKPFKILVSYISFGTRISISASLRFLTLPPFSLPLHSPLPLPPSQAFLLFFNRLLASPQNTTTTTTTQPQWKWNGNNNSSTPFAQISCSLLI